MIPIIMMLFGISTLGQFQLEIPEDCTYESEQDGTCGYGMFPPQP
tara:strand:- start:813 stop:947 length:135 start_codon:yes stop_codon:yes gene_type:complete